MTMIRMMKKGSQDENDGENLVAIRILK